MFIYICYRVTPITYLQIVVSSRLKKVILYSHVYTGVGLGKTVVCSI